MAIRTVVTAGFGNGTFAGTIPLVVTSGYAIGASLVSFTGTGTIYRPSRIGIAYRTERIGTAYRPDRTDVTVSEQQGNN